MIPPMSDFSRLAHLLLNGDLLRLRAPLVRDLLEGISAAVAQSAAQVLPNLTRPTRPALHFEHSEWPPKTGDYTELGFVRSWSQMTKLGLALTYPEIAAFLVGLAQHEIPRKWQAEQLYNAAHALSRVLFRRERDTDDYQGAWEFLFSGHGSTAEGTTKGLELLTLPVRSAGASGVYRVTAECLLSSTSAAAGSLLIAGTFSSDGESIRLVRSDQILAQLDPALYGVSAGFRAAERTIEVVCTGLTEQEIQWSSRTISTSKVRNRSQQR